MIDLRGVAGAHDVVWRALRPAPATFRLRRADIPDTVDAVDAAASALRTPVSVFRVLCCLPAEQTPVVVVAITAAELGHRFRIYR